MPSMSSFMTFPGVLNFSDDIIAFGKLSLNVSTKSGITVDVNMFAGRVAGGDSQALKPGRSAYNLRQERPTAHAV